MGRQAKASKARSKKESAVTWSRFDSNKSILMGGNPRVLEGCFASLQVPAGSTHRDVLKTLASHCEPHLAIESLSDDLRNTTLLRGETIFGFAANIIDDIAQQHEGVHWWLSKVGLNVMKVPLSRKMLSAFDALAGRLYVEGSDAGRLPNELLHKIVLALDEAGFKLKELRGWNLIANYNERHRLGPLRKFSEISSHRDFVRMLKRRLYLARQRYIASLPPSQKLSQRLTETTLSISRLPA